MAAAHGVPVVLTADRTLMAHYDVLLDGMMASSQTTTTPRLIMDWLLMPRGVHVDGNALCAPLGLRRIEAALLRGGFSPEDIAVVDDTHLQEVIGPATRIIGISSGEPCGFGMSSTTMAGISGGTIYPHALFNSLLGKVNSLRASVAPDAKIVVGGPGAWQLAAGLGARETLGIDHVVVGYCEGNIAEFFSGICSGNRAQPVLEGVGVEAGEIPSIQAASTMGVVEISRGCGLGCEFCSIASEKMGHLPVSTIIEDIETNIAVGNTSISLLSEDFFRYGATGMQCNPDDAIGLLETLRNIPELRLLQIDHANIASIMQYSDAELQTVAELLTGGKPHGCPWVNLGVETASGRLLAENGGAAKMAGMAPACWGDECITQLRRLAAAGFTPMASIVVGLPGETPEDVCQTLDWVKRLRHDRVTVFPVFFAPIESSQPMTTSTLTRLHWQLVRECYRLNFRWMPRIYWGNQTVAGVSFPKRAILQLLGKGQVLRWAWVLWAHARKAPE